MSLDLDIRSLGQRWAEARINESRPDSLVSIHIDELLRLPAGTLRVDESCVRLALEAFTGVLHADGVSAAEIMPLLVVALRSAETMKLTPVRWLDAGSAALGDMPPEIYLIDRRARVSPQRDEEYLCPVEPPEIEVPERWRLGASYRCRRDAFTLDHGWPEYARGLYVEAHPAV